MPQREGACLPILQKQKLEFRAAAWLKVTWHRRAVLGWLLCAGEWAAGEAEKSQGGTLCPQGWGGAHEATNFLKNIAQNYGDTAVSSCPSVLYFLGETKAGQYGMKPGLSSSRYPMWGLASGGLRARIPNLPWKFPGTACLEVRAASWKPSNLG